MISTRSGHIREPPGKLTTSASSCSELSRTARPTGTRRPATAPRTRWSRRCSRRCPSSSKSGAWQAGLLLLPFFHAPSQWTPAIPLLARHFTVVSLGGRHRRARGSRSCADLSGDVPYPDRHDRATAGRGDPRCRVRCRLARPTAGAPSWRRQPDHRDRHEPVYLRKPKRSRPRTA